MRDQPQGSRFAGRLLALAVPFMGRMALAVLLGVATIASGIGLMTTAAYIISKAALRPSIADLQVAIVGVRFFGIARGVFRYLERYVSHDVTFRLLARLRVRFYQALEPLAPARLLQYRSGDLLARIVTDAETLEHFFLRGIAPPVVALLVALLAAGLVGSFDARLAVTLLGFLLLAGVGVPLVMGALGRGTGRRLVQIRAELNGALVDGIQGVADLLAFGGERRYLETLKVLSAELGNLQSRMTRIGALDSALTGLLMNLVTVAVLVVAIPLVVGGEVGGVYLASLALAAMASFEAVLPLPNALQHMETSLAAAQRMFEVIDTEPVVRDPRVPAAYPRNCGLQAEGLSFAYEPGATPALDGISFELPSGGVVALVGPSGAGKTTLLYLLLRFWQPQKGRILLGGQELQTYGEEDLRRLIGVVSQHTYLFNATVRENLLLARPMASEAEMIRAAQAAQIDQFVQSLPEGYETWIGEQGLRLSGGERQRLAIARALLKDAPILVLDEPTANLDALTERAVMEALRTLMVGRTVLIVTHRLVGLEAADAILVLQSGRIVQRGRHHELLQAVGPYRRMWEVQAQMLA
jgi:thiol reductant ABC exporter CydC subunit